MGVQANASDIHLTGTVATAPSTGEPISITTWLSATWSSATAGAKSLVGIYGPSAAAPVTAIQIGSRTTNNAVFVWTWGGATLINSPAGVVADGVTHFIAYTFDGTNHRLYVDGVLTATSANVQIAGQFNTFYINGYPTGNAGETSTQIIESVRMYNRELTQNEITTIYTSRGARHNVAYGMIAYYEFDEGATAANTTICYDLTGGGANLTPSGAGTAMTYTYSSGESTHRPAVIN